MEKELDQASLEKKKIKEAKDLAKEQITYERARIAIEKMQLSWVRKSIIIAALGVAVYRVFEKEEVSKGGGLVFGFVTAREIGLLMVLIAFVSLLLVTFQHVQAHKKIKVQYELYQKMPRSASLLLTYAILAITLFLFLAFLSRYSSGYIWLGS
jgi:uncharacterized membrane protein YidH (DUF202 family)